MGSLAVGAAFNQYPAVLLLCPVSAQQQGNKGGPAGYSLETAGWEKSLEKQMGKIQHVVLSLIGL